MAALELVEKTTHAVTRKEVTETQTLVAGGKVKCEVGNNELSETVPQGKVWDVVANIRIVERDA